MRSPRRAVACLLGLAVALAAERARAEGRSWFGLDLEGHISRNTDTHNSDLYTFGGGVAVHVELNVHPLVGLHFGGAWFGLPGHESPESAAWLGGRAGARLHWSVWLPAVAARGDDAWVDLHYNFGASGEIERGGFDLGVGYVFATTRPLRVGGFVRYQFGSDPDGQNPQVLHFGVSIGLLGAPREAAPDRPAPSVDADSDGVADAQDACPVEPAGATPDPRRRGCAARDQDGDGVADYNDVCPTTGGGAQPDPARLGCPLADTDSDGVADARDYCVTIPTGPVRDPRREGCPAVDIDGDGVYDHEDECANASTGARPDPVRRGCPLTDRDEDLVADSVDHCPDEPGAPSQFAERNGCPGLVRIDGGRVVLLRPIEFAPRSDRFLMESEGVLAALSDVILAAGLRRVRIESHTDNRGVPRVNLHLTQQRAEAVRLWLARHGVDATWVEAAGAGSLRPLVSNATPAGRASNRRVEVHILDGQYVTPTLPATPPRRGRARGRRLPRGRR